ncbi:GIY-YIG nuclease family protein [Cupriavidus respiraculi]|uniref:Bacteriophage T5 Orf172 DNA-binding domain-containing protein n=1 Tax=Cupriavidus respiraculi TaxID=195930 RepID=A0ABM8XU60_9BURK|nr:GIY-YIG nuclease family protein [Cupriavidus respiraculi]MBY4949519.1 GIY-YIG nuclease family protein [Cupriavidus respiraculi]CAG9183914.1 hypothetical protein LMG21510_04977 [Cupriavidus respiraculi]
MLAPAQYWRIALDIDDVSVPSSVYPLPPCLTSQTRPPAPGDGLLLAAYDRDSQMGMIRWIGLIDPGQGELLCVNWRPVEAQIWVDTVLGRRFWSSKPGFRFADSKVTPYGLVELFLGNFEGMERRTRRGKTTSSPIERAPRSRQQPRRVSVERLVPSEIVGEPTDSTRTGVVYVLQSAYGHKVGRTRNVPARMRAFGVHLPFLYTIPLCAWFDDCVAAESYYHAVFADKRINGEWFDLTDADIERIRSREFAGDSTDAVPLREPSAPLTSPLTTIAIEQHPRGRVHS